MKLLTIKQACERAAIGRTMLYGLIARGHIEARKMGQRTRIVCESLERWMGSLPRKSDAKERR